MKRKFSPGIRIWLACALRCLIGALSCGCCSAKAHRNDYFPHIKMPRGRPKYEPSEADRNTVRSMAATGFTHEAISKCLGTNGVDEKTLRKHFRHELDTAAQKANAAVANKAYQMAIAGDPPAATFFWLKCRANWREKQEIEHSGPGGGDFQMIVRSVLDPKPE